MCNCGNKRNAYTQQAYTAADTNAIGNTIQKNVFTSFQYNGSTGLTVTGSITRKSYRFNYPGDIQAVDQRDARAMIGIAVLKKLG